MAHLVASARALPPRAALVGRMRRDLPDHVALLERELVRRLADKVKDGARQRRLLRVEDAAALDRRLALAENRHVLLREVAERMRESNRERIMRGRESV